MGFAGGPQGEVVERDVRDDGHVERIRDGGGWDVAGALWDVEFASFASAEFRSSKGAGAKTGVRDAARGCRDEL